jgi:asparagine synthase (glutamine-hydrolysing)
VTGVCGWFGELNVDRSALIEAMRQHVSWTGAPSERSETGDAFGLAAVGHPHTIGVFAFGALRIAFHGHGLWRDGTDRALPPVELCERLATAYRERGPDALTRLAGDFSLALLDLEKRQALLAIDRMGVRNLVYRVEQDALIFAPNLDALGAHPLVTHRVAPQALYDYVYFHMVPGPRTIFQDSRRLLPGHYLLSGAGKTVAAPYWEMRFEETAATDERELERRFRDTLRAGVEARAMKGSCGTFLSGGTDSSTVTGLLSEVSGGRVGTYSIGFDATGYDEMDYARITARHFRTDHHEYYVTPQDVVAAIPLVAAEYDQPFGNASAIPTYYCAKLARDSGVVRMLAGDGGDELFGGNTRYARQYQFSLYERVPAWLRTGLLEPLAATRIAEAIPILRKGKSYVEQARLPMPARYESYNLLERFGPRNVFEPEFLARVDPTQPIAMLSRAYESAHASSLINRLLALDLKFTLADNDLPKVTRMCDRAGVDVAFPLLDDAVVAFSAALQARMKVRGTRLRYFFKRALRDFLPRETLAKHKHGFGLPAGPWLATDEPLRKLSLDALGSLRERRIFKRRFLDDLVETQLREHAGYYGTMVWVLMMLELWFQQRRTLA